MARLGHPPHVVGAILNHAPGATQGITASTTASGTTTRSGPRLTPGHGMSSASRKVPPPRWSSCAGPRHDRSLVYLATTHRPRLPWPGASIAIGPRWRRWCRPAAPTPTRRARCRAAAESDEKQETPRHEKGIMFSAPPPCSRNGAWRKAWGTGSEDSKTGGRSDVWCHQEGREEGHHQQPGVCRPTPGRAEALSPSVPFEIISTETWLNIRI